MNPTLETSIKQHASVHEVVMEKKELLKRLQENKSKHDIVLATAIEGYWDIAKEKIETKQKSLEAQMVAWEEEATRQFNKILNKIEKKEPLPFSVSLKAVTIDTGLDLVYPEDHSADYERAIQMMKSSIYDTVELSSEEYDSYVLNNWEWKKNFVASNATYVNTMRSKYNRVAGPQGPVGEQGNAGVEAAYSRSLLADGLTNSF